MKEAEMRLIRKQLSLWRIVLIIAVAAIAIPTAGVRVATNAQSDEEEYWSRRIERRLDRRQEYLDRQTGDDKDDEDAKDSKDSKDAKDDDGDDADDVVDKDIERRREYWRKRLDDEW
jgi:uncharacterized membrane protein YdbT with pleckstrin-like domain